MIKKFYFIFFGFSILPFAQTMEQFSDLIKCPVREMIDYVLDGLIGPSTTLYLIDFSFLIYSYPMLEMMDEYGFLHSVKSG